MNMRENENSRSPIRKATLNHPVGGFLFYATLLAGYSPEVGRAGSREGTGSRVLSTSEGRGNGEGQEGGKGKVGAWVAANAMADFMAIGAACRSGGAEGARGYG